MRHFKIDKYFVTAVISFLFSATLGSSEEGFLSGLNVEEFSNSKPVAKVNNNPFVQSTKQQSIHALKLYAIAYSKKGSAALIGQKIIRVGDSIAGSRVISILRDRVVLQTRDGLFELSFLKGEE